MKAISRDSTSRSSTRSRTLSHPLRAGLTVCPKVCRIAWLQDQYRRRYDLRPLDEMAPKRLSLPRLFRTKLSVTWRSQVAQQLLNRYPQRRVRVLVVWEPILATDWRSPSGSTLARISDLRVRQFWDPKHVVATTLSEFAKKNPSRNPVAVFRKDSIGMKQFSTRPTRTGKTYQHQFFGMDQFFESSQG